MRSRFAVAVILSVIAGAPAMAGGVAVQRAPEGSNNAVPLSPYLPGSPVWGSPYVAGPVLGSVFYDGPTDEALGARVFTPSPGVSCSFQRHACWTPAGIDRGWSVRLLGSRSQS